MRHSSRKSLSASHGITMSYCEKRHKMTFSGFDNMTFIEQRVLSHQKINGTCGFETTPADGLKIEIPINKINSATYNTDGIINKLVMVFAFAPAPLTDLYNIVPRPRQYQSTSNLYRDLFPATYQHYTAKLVMSTKLVPGWQKPRRASLLRLCTNILLNH